MLRVSRLTQRLAVGNLAIVGLVAALAGCGGSAAGEDPGIPRPEARERVRRAVQDTSRTIAGSRDISEVPALSGPSSCGEAGSGLYRDTFTETFKVPARDIDRLLEQGRQYWTGKGAQIVHDAHPTNPIVYVTLGSDLRFSIVGRETLGDIQITGTTPCYRTAEG